MPASSPLRPLMLLRALLVACLVPAAGAQSVLVVDAANGPGAQYTSLQAAIDAANDGDVLLIRSGAYHPATPLSIDGKALVLSAEQGAVVSVGVGACIENLGAARFVAVRGVDFASGIRIQECQGPVWLEDGDVDPDALSGTGVTVLQSRVLVLRDCSLRSGLDFAGTARAALTAIDSGVRAFESSLEGQAGSDGFSFGGTPTLPDPGSPGLLALGDSDAWLLGSEVHGGDGGGWLTGVSPPMPGADGGPGVRLLDTARVSVLESNVQGGSGGSGGGGGSPGANGQAFDNAPSAELVERPEASRSKSVPSPLREGEAFTITHGGLAGDSVWALVSSRPGSALLGGKWLGRPDALVVDRTWTGPIVVGFPLLTTRFHGVLPASGSQDSMLTAPALPAGRSALVLFDQSLFLGPKRFVAGAPSLVVVLDDSL